MVEDIIYDVAFVLETEPLAAHEIGEITGIGLDVSGYLAEGGGSQETSSVF
ncbi:hypothetical protein [uncultured Pontibacter sp.]|uniref:hypothetical protein n=1 Tax=uncultured Pontibacter sp. TaxID=453356 RepID=UPI002610110D|nr:hypothetical protein [uncultured Pontibacter sp.]